MKKIIVVMCAVIMHLCLTMAAVSAAEFSECYYRFDGSVSTIKLSGTVSEEYKKVPVTVLLTDSDTVSSWRNIKHISQAKVDSNKNWTASFSLRGDASEYSIKIRQDNIVSVPSLKQIVALPEENADSLFEGAEACFDENGNISATVMLKKPENLTSAKVILAVKDFDGNLLAARIKTVEFSGEESQPVSDVFAADIVDEDVYVEMYCFDDLTSIKPLTAKKKIPVSMTIAYVENNEPITKNPGKGFIRYGTTNAVAGGDTVLADKLLDYSQAGYMRYTWEQLEPIEGQYNWTSIDNALEYWDNLGMQFAFGLVIGYNSGDASGGAQIPDWVFEAGAESVVATNSSGVEYKTPVNNDPIYLEKLGNFLATMGARYDGDERVAFIDARLQGNYGEGHNSGLDAAPLVWGDDLKNILDLYVNNFKNTQLVPTVFVDPALHSYLRENNMGMRCDGILDSVVEDLMVPNVYGSGPAVLEMVGGGWHNLNHEILESSRLYWDVPMYYNSIKYTRASYLDIGEWGIGSEKYIEAEEDMVKTLANRIGYHFVLKNAEMPNKVLAGDSFKISMDWMNKGINYLYLDARLDFALLDEQGDEVVRYTTSISPTRNWEPEKEITESITMAFSDIADGEYSLAIGLFRNDNDNIADYRIGNYDRTENGWYVIADVSKTGEVFNFSYNRQYSEAEENVCGVIENSGFENGTVSWSIEDAFSVTSDMAANGSCSLKVNNTEAGKRAYQNFYSSNDRLYEMTFKAKADSAVKYRVLTPAGKEISAGEIPASNAFVTYNVPVHYADVGAVVLGAPYKLGALTIEFETTGNGGYAYIDDVLLTDGTMLVEYYQGTDNLMRDYGMEIESTGWFARSKGNVIRTRENPYSGDWCIKTIKRSKGQGMEYDITDELKENGAGTYKLEVWVRSESGYIYLNASAQGNTYPLSTGENYTAVSYGNKNTLLGTKWTKVSLEFSVTNEQINGQDRNVIVLRDDSLTNFAIDDASLVKVN